ncbi:MULTISPECIES: NAD/NADP-dependent octopine/nopaline dehydrogenase family protein [unclassified Paraburkholderia]|uniref:NAD/NADP-dependent octopine/nopaline dehydrogenase family protein n=1 Tax=unclassified Paraburkholderia TaxID=2615204 RepID=UPI002AB24E9B|nr:MULTISPECIES: NAD/NADP octopine/nopaline dehydrogenase family protein [unclassified Paraburkholderia]
MSASATVDQLNVVVCGGGRTGHLAAVLFARLPGVHVTLYTNNPAVVENYQHDEGVTAILPDGTRCSAQLDAVTSDPGAACREADIVIVTVPAHVRPQLLEQIASSLPSHKPVYVGAIPGFCGFDWLAEKTFANRDNVVIWGMKDVPHIASDLCPGVSVRMGGAKSALYAATHSRESKRAREALLRHLSRLYEASVELLGDYLEITLTPGNPIMHSSVLYGLIGPYGQWHETTFAQSLCWWSDCPELGAYFLERSDEENQRLCKALEQRLDIDLSSVKPLKQEIVEAYEEQIADPRTMLSVLRTNQAYDAIALPLVHEAHRDGYVIDREHRAFHEDVAFGLSLLVEMGRRLNVRLPHIEEVFQWNVSYMQGLRRSALDYFPESWPA